jgi:mediator of RNA polymerase II transcription subunit 5
LQDKASPTDLFWSPAVIYPVEDLNGENAAAFTAWTKALFDSSSEGIEDTILRWATLILNRDIIPLIFRSTKPKTLLLISATLFSHAISARADRKMDADVLNNGVSYFTGPLLNWTLVGVIKTLLREIQMKGLVPCTKLSELLTMSPKCICDYSCGSSADSSTIAIMSSPGFKPL